MPDKHTSDCDWHVDQYPWECTCGFIPRKKAMDDLIAQDADLIDKLRDEDSYYRIQEKHWCIDAEELERQRLAAADRIEALETENARLREACEKVKKSALATAKIRLVKLEREMEVCRSNMSRAKMKCRANEASILLGELRALDVAAIIGDSHD